MMARTLVVPLVSPRTDPEHVSEQALPMALALARRTGASIVLLSVLDRPSEPRWTSGAQLPPDIGPECEAHPRLPRERTGEAVLECRSWLEGLLARADGPRGTALVRVGDPATEIVSVAEELAEPVIVMASRTRRALSRALLGSVALDVVERARCPVLVVPAPTRCAPRPPRIERIVVPLDGSAVGESALVDGLAVLGPADLEVRLLHVVEPLVRHTGIGSDAYIALAADEAARYLQRTAEGLVERGYRVTWDVRGGFTRDVIAAVTEGSGADLIVMATHGRGGWRRRLFGSVVERLARLRLLPILIVHPSRVEAAGRRGDVAAEESPPLDDVCVRDLMNADVVPLPETASLAQVTRTMLDRHVGCVPIVDAEGRLAGILTEADFTGTARATPVCSYRLPVLFRDWLAGDGTRRVHTAGRVLSARQLMSRPVVTAREDEPITAVMARMIEHDVGCVPVVRDGRPVGLVTSHDLLRLLLPHGAPAAADVPRRLVV